MILNIDMSVSQTNISSVNQAHILSLNRTQNIVVSDKSPVSNAIENVLQNDRCDFADKTDCLKGLHSMFVNLTPQDVALIKKSNQKDAAKYCFDLICKSMKIPEEIAPELILDTVDEDIPRLSGLYNFMQNDLHYFTQSETNTNLGRWWMFGLIRHEMEHYRQNIDMFRSKDISAKLFDYYEKLLKDSKCSDEEIADYFKSLKDFQSKILKYYPPIKPDSKEYKKANKFYENYINYTYGTNGFLDRLKYFIQPIEFEACRVQGFNWVNYFLKNLITPFSKPSEQ